MGDQVSFYTIEKCLLTGRLRDEREKQTSYTQLTESKHHDELDHLIASPSPTQEEKAEL